MRSEDDKVFQTIQNLYALYDRGQGPSGNILAFPVALSPTGESILDDVDHLLRRSDFREMIEERLLTALSDIAREIMQKNGV